MQEFMRKIIYKIIKKFSPQQKYIKSLKKSGIKIGMGCEIYKDVDFGSEPYLIKIGNHVRITTGCKFITHDGGVWVLRKLYKNEEIDLFGKIEIGDNVHIGMNTIIMPGVTIGNNVVIGCGAIVTKNIPDNEVWCGIPAKRIKSIDDYFEQHQDNFDYTKLFSYEKKKKYLLKKFDEINIK